MNLTHEHWVCLMFHDVLPRTSASGGGPERFAVTLAGFERILDAIAERGHLGCSMSAAVRGKGRPRVAITFDDGTRSQFDYAVPALRERGMTATFFVTTDWVGTSGHMSWDQLRRLSDWEMSVQSHTKSHAFLSELDAPQLLDELAGSREALDRELGQDTVEIAFPGGDAPRRSLRHVLGTVGYRVAAGSRWGINRDPTDDHIWPPVRRCTVQGDPTSDLALRLVAGDRRLALRRYPRERALAWLRSALGPSRYARLRRRVLDAVSRSGTP